jgi:uncharacterized repeat protein (TIGR03803 family)
MERFRSAKLAGMLFVVCSAAVIAVHAQTYATLHSFDGTDGSYPEAPLIQAADGSFYGTTVNGGTNNNCSYGCGTVFKITAAGALNTLYDFCSQTNCADGSFPYAGLVQATDGNFYGTTADGGANGKGTVFKITAAGTLTTIYSFCSQTNCADGSLPYAGLVQATDGNFYGTTVDGGANGWGTVFKITAADELTTLYSFCSQDNCADGQGPNGLIQATDGNFYGTTSKGGAIGYGTIFKITPAGAPTTLYSFCSLLTTCADGAYPEAGLVQATDGNFYGTTPYGGVGSLVSGTVFKITPGGTLTTLHTFSFRPAGEEPDASLVQAIDGTFYSTTALGGLKDAGTIFEVGPGGRLTTLHSFSWTDGGGATGGLIQATDGNFYGTTASGGASRLGTIFSLTAPPPPEATLRSSLGFSSQALNQTSAPETVGLKNSGTAILAISGITISGNFAVVSASKCAPGMARNETCQVSVTFTPTVLGSQTGALTFTDNAPDSPQTVALSGTGVEPASLTPVTSTYGAQAVGMTSAAKTFTLINRQTVTLTNIATSTTGDFAVSATTCTTSLAAKENCTISVTFTPTQTGTRTGGLVESDSAGNSPQTSSLQGTGK